MNKAFTKEDEGNVPGVVPPRASLPPGTPNYVTPHGLAQLKIELKQLEHERAELDARVPGADRSHDLVQLAARRAALEDRLASAELVDATKHPRDEVRFGARVEVRPATGAARTYRIVGVDEADPKAGLVAFVSPMARALLGRSVGETVNVRTPRGGEELEIVRVDYDEAH